MQLELVSHRPPFPQLAEQAPPHEIASAALQQKPQQKEEQKEATADATADAAHTPEPAPKPKAGTGTNCNFNAQEQDKQHIELQKQHLDLPEQAPPHESASAALNRKNRKNRRSNSRCCSYPTAQTKPKAGTGTNCSLNAQEQGKQHIELQKQHLDLPEQAPPHESASAALQQKRQQKQNKTQQQMLLTPHGPNETQSRTWHQLQLKCAGARQAAQRIAEAASTNGRASTST